MDLIIDSEFRDLIPPLMVGEYRGLESSIVENGFNPAFPIIVWKGQNIIVDGHNRYDICQKHGLPFEFIEQEFASRYEVVAWILENQIFRRNVNSLTRLYLIGRRYLVEKNELGENQYTNNSLNRVVQNGLPSESKSTRDKIAAQLKVGNGTIARANELTKAIDTIVSNTGINRMSILTGDVKGTQDEIKELAAMDAESQKRIVDLILNEGELSISLASSRLWDENHAKALKEVEEKKKQMEEQSKAQREEEAAKERERLRIEHEARVQQENERLEKEKEEQEKNRLAEIERQKKKN
jgi:hypothetical protein